MHQHQSTPMNDTTTKSSTRRTTLQISASFILSALSCFSLISIAILLIPQAVKIHRYNRCVDVQIAMRAAINPQGLRSPGRMHYLKAVEHCEGL